MSLRLWAILLLVTWSGRNSIIRLGWGWWMEGRRLCVSCIIDKKKSRLGFLNVDKMVHSVHQSTGFSRSRLTSKGVRPWGPLPDVIPLDWPCSLWKHTCCFLLFKHREGAGTFCDFGCCPALKMFFFLSMPFMQTAYNIIGLNMSTLWETAVM